MEKRDGEVHPKISMYLAKKEMFNKLEPVIKVMLNLHDMCIEVAEEADVDPDVLMDWVSQQLPKLDTCGGDESEDEDDE